MKTNTIEFNKFLKHLKSMSALEYLLEVLPPCSREGPWIAGGALHRTYKNLPLHDSDVDIFFKDGEQLNEYVRKLLSDEKIHGKYKSKNYVVTQWHHSIVIEYMNNDWKIQCVSFKYFPSIEELFKSFDINVCRLAYDGEQIVGEENVLVDINSNTLKFNSESINYPGVTLKRLVKYIKMGYNVDDVELKHLLNAFYRGKKNKTSEVDLENVESKSKSNDDYKNLHHPGFCPVTTSSILSSSIQPTVSQQNQKTAPTLTLTGSYSIQPNILTRFFP